MNKSNIKVLAVDDEKDVRQIIEYNLTKEGYEVKTAKDGLEALTLAKHLVPDLIILDVMMPNMDGIEACKLMREVPALKDVIIVFLTARSEEFLEIAGFDAGADDYIAKPIKPRLLLSRINAIMRRKREPVESAILSIKAGDLIIDKESFLVYRGEESFTLAKKEFQLLFLLASKPGKVFSRETILDQVWGTDMIVVNRTIDVHIRKIREKIGDDYIKTVKGVGYKFVGQ